MSLPLGAVTSPDNLYAPLKHLYGLWRGKLSDDGSLPARSDFDPTEIPADFLPYITLFDVVRSNTRLRFHIRLVGTGIVEEIGRDTTGAFLDELPSMSRIIERAEWIVMNRQPIYVEDQPVTWTSMDYKNYSALGVPLASDGRNVDKIFYQMAFS